MDNPFFHDDSFSAPDPWQSEIDNSDPFDLFDVSDDFSSGEMPEDESFEERPFSFSPPIIAQRLGEMISEFIEPHSQTDDQPETEDAANIENMGLENTLTSNDFFPTADTETSEMETSPEIDSNDATTVADDGTQGNFFDDIFNYFWSFTDIVPDELFVHSYVSQDSFTDDGTYDPVNNLIVEGDVKHDIIYVDQQHAQDCSLMAQEQFVHRYFGENVPEEVLEEIGLREQVYDPEKGTYYEGQTLILEHFGVPFERNYPSTMEELEIELDSDHDCIVSVTTREFYSNPNYPPNSLHSVAVVGKGVDPETGETLGFYVTDSNYPDGAHFLTLDAFQDCWTTDMISIPNQPNNNMEA